MPDHPPTLPISPLILQAFGNLVSEPAPNILIAHVGIWRQSALALFPPSSPPPFSLSAPVIWWGTDWKCDSPNNARDSPSNTRNSPNNTRNSPNNTRSSPNNARHFMGGWGPLQVAVRSGGVRAGPRARSAGDHPAASRYPDGQAGLRPHELVHPHVWPRPGEPPPPPVAQGVRVCVSLWRGRGKGGRRERDGGREGENPDACVLPPFPPRQGGGGRRRWVTRCMPGLAEIVRLGWGPGTSCAIGLGPARGTLSCARGHEHKWGSGGTLGTPGLAPARLRACEPCLPLHPCAWAGPDKPACLAWPWGVAAGGPPVSAERICGRAQE